MIATIHLHPVEGDDLPVGRVIADGRLGVAQLALSGSVTILGSAADPNLQRWLAALAEEANTLAVELGYRADADEETGS